MPEYPRSTDGAPLVEVEKLTFAYDSARVLDVDRLEVHRGDITVLTGHNGSGKTTLLKVINGLLQPSGGVVRLWGESIATGRGRRMLRSRSVLVHQKPYLFHESVASNIRYVAKLREPNARDIEARIEEALAVVRLEDVAHRRASGLSGGEKQRIAIARALAVRPDLLLLDEPTSNIDPESIRAIERALREVNRAGTTILMTTHNLATAYRLATRVYPMTAGHIEHDRNNVFRGHIENTDEYFTYFRIGGGSGSAGAGPTSAATAAAASAAAGPEKVQATGPVIRVPAQDRDTVAAVIPMDDIILSREPFESSAQNHFSGRVTAIEPYQQGRRIDVDCDGVIMSALITPYAIEQLGLGAGSEVHLAFKASAVRLY
ncbi:MAG: ATP-binding cassette domain-containing protein [Spirochaetota bacterium]